MTIYTIGVYGWTAKTFIDALERARVTTLVDIRRRRGVRGPLYRFANATALEKLVTRSGIAYIAEPALAPTQEMLDVQHAADKASGLPMRAREELTPEFIQRYKREVLREYSAADLDALLQEAGARPAFMCVEQSPKACHRALLAERIAKRDGARIKHLEPV